MTRDEDFEDYVQQRRHHLYRTAWLLCGDPHRAEDLVQETLTKLYRAWSRVSCLDVDPYVRRMLVNSHIDETRRPWRRRERPTSDPPDAPVPAGAEEADELWAALRALPAGQRRIVVLRHYWGLSVEETAVDLGIAVGTVKSQTSVALKSLRRVLAPESATASTARAGDDQGDT